MIEVKNHGELIPIIEDDAEEKNSSMLNDSDLARAMAYYKDIDEKLVSEKSCVSEKQREEAD